MSQETMSVVLTDETKRMYIVAGDVGSFLARLRGLIDVLEFEDPNIEKAKKEDCNEGERNAEGIWCSDFVGSRQHGRLGEG